MRLPGNDDKMEICGYWGAPGNHLFTAPSCHCHDKKEQRSKVSPDIKDFATISHFEWDTDMHVGKMRKLVSESRVIFLEVQRAAQESSTTSKQTDAEMSNEYLNFSHQYMSSLKSTISEVQGQLKFERDKTQREIMEKQLKMLEPFELLWGLCEAIFIDNTRGGYILGHLMEWLRLRFYDSDLKVQKVIESQLGEKHELYWEVMYTFVLQGRIEEARRLLMLHGESKSDNCMRIDLLLGHMPVYSPSNPRLSFTEWSMKWQQWHMTCVEHIEDDVFAGDDNLNTLCKILAGDEDVFTEVKHLMGTWYCLLISKLFYQSPMITSSDLRHFSQPCIDLFGSEVMTSWDKVILSILHLDIKQAIDECCSSFNNWWFVCHMTDLLEHKGCLEKKILPFGSTIREFVLLEYVNSLISDRSLLEVGIDYLSNCPVFGRAHIGELVLRAYSETEVKVRKMIRICEKYELHEEASIICREQGLGDLRRGLVGSALYWCIRAKDADLAILLVRKILLEGLLPAPELGQLDFINNFGSSVGFSNELALLGKLTEFQRQSDQALYNEAASTLFIIFSEKSSKRFWRFLFSRLVELLEVGEVQLTKEQTTKFLQCLTDHELRGDCGDAENSHKLPDDEVLKIRVYLAQSMALNFVNPK